MTRGQPPVWGRCKSHTLSTYSLIMQKIIATDQVYKAKVVIARQLRKQKGKHRPTWTIRWLANNYSLNELVDMLHDVPMPT